MQVKLLYTLIICAAMTLVLAESNDDNGISEYQDSDYFESPEFANNEEDNGNEGPYFPAEYQAKNYRESYAKAEAEDEADPTPGYEDDDYSNENAQFFEDNSDLVDQA